jgi:hypothetical protein
VKFTTRKVEWKNHGSESGCGAGPDGIGPRLLKELSSGLALALAVIFNKSMSKGEVPSNWREANATPIFKKGAKSSPGNYRPVSHLRAAN